MHAGMLCIFNISGDPSALVALILGLLFRYARANSLDVFSRAGDVARASNPTANIIVIASLSVSIINATFE